jgi:hypothetical protein
VLGDVPGNTADVTSLLPVIERLRRRFAIGRICVVADRGMLSSDTLAALEAAGYVIFSVHVNGPTWRYAMWCLPTPRRSCR